jgi:hypothetical protein
MFFPDSPGNRARIATNNNRQASASKKPSAKTISAGRFLGVTMLIAKSVARRPFEMVSPLVDGR